jgi:hypothetical protein
LSSSRDSKSPPLARTRQRQRTSACQRWDRIKIIIELWGGLHEPFQILCYSRNEDNGGAQPEWLSEFRHDPSDRKDASPRMSPYDKMR